METPRNRTLSLVAFACLLGASFLVGSHQQLYGACAAPPTGLVSWWPGEGNVLDLQGTNNGIFTNAAYGAGEVGQAFSFDGSGNNVRVPASASMNVGSGGGLTIEAWINSADNTSSRPIVEWVPNAVGAFGAHFYVNQGGPGALYANLYDTANTSHTIQTAAGLVLTNVYRHVAVTYDKASGTARLYVNGALATESIVGTFTPQTSPDLSIGFRPNTVPFGPISFKGRIDEVSLYSRALSTNEIQAIYNAGSAGKCFSAPPTILLQPTNETVFVGRTATLNVLAAGSQPLSYQWTLAGTNLMGATNASLILTNAQLTDAGTYSVQVTNSLGSILSSNAVLTVETPTCTTPPSGLVSWWPADGNAVDIIGTNNGTASSGASFASGEVGEGFGFNGASGYIQVPDSPSLSFTNAFTIELWYKDNGQAGGTYAGLIAKRPYSGPCNFGVSISGGTSGSFLVYFLDPNYGSYQGSTFSPLPAAGSWHHLAASYRQAAAEQLEIKNFIDGQLVKTTTLNGNLSRTVNNAPVTIGCSNPTGGEFFKGDIDEPSIYNRALADSEIAAIFNAGALGKCLPPTPPSIFIQPTNQAALTGATVSFNVGAFGSQPLSYQWTMDGTNLPGSTSASLVLTNVQLSQNGTYAVVITNSFGSVTSSNAVLTVNVPPLCAPPPAGLVSWWPGEGNANDNEGANNGVFTNPSYANGEVGQAFNFDGSGNNVRVPASVSMNVGAGNGMTIEAWVLWTDNSTSRPIVEWVPKTSGTFGAHFWVAAQGGLYANLYDTANTSHIIQTAAGFIATNSFQHVAITYDKPSGIARLFVNGAQIAQSTLGSFTPQTSPDLSIGLRPNTVPFGPTSFIGRIDEVSLYGRALSSSEIQAIYKAAESGKCNTPLPPTVFLQPTNQTLIIGQTTTFQVQAGGTWPLSYQWSLNSTKIPGATNASLVLTNVQMNQAGIYSVVVSNAYGTATSSNATLVVNFPPAAVNVVNVSGMAGGLVTVPVVLVANGNENAIGFSLNFSPTLLTNAGVSLGTGASGASLIVNPNQAGAVGVGVALASGSTFAPGTQEVAEVSFMSMVSTTNFTAALNFGDLPTKRELSDANARTLAANFIGGQILLTRSAFEADVAPRPDGDGDVTIADWVQVGRFVAALDSPTNASEFQRADCAPRDTLGDGLLTVSDWVQAGRYAAGLDPLTMAGGPTGPPAGGVVAGLFHKEGSGPQRAVSFTGPVIFQSQAGAASVTLQAQGDENAVGLSLAFDPAIVRYVGSSAGADASTAAMDINANQATNGQVGIILALPTGTSFSPGTRELVKIHFQALTAASVNSIVALTDVPVRREVSDTNALAVASIYNNGTIQVNPRPSVSIGLSSQNVSLAWPLWATNYNLQQATGGNLPVTNWNTLAISPVATNNALSVTLPITNSIHFYRLQHQ